MISAPNYNGAHITIVYKEQLAAVESLPLIDRYRTPQLLEGPECIEMELIKILRKLSKKNIFIN